MILRAMQDAKNDDFAPDDAEKYFIRKAMRENAAKATVIKRKTFRISFQTQEGFGVIGEKFITESGAPFFIPVVRAAKVGLGLGPDGDVPIHRREARISPRTLRQGSPGLGSRS